MLRIVDRMGDFRMRKFNVFYNVLGWRKMLVVEAKTFFEATKLAERKVKSIHKFGFVEGISAQI